MEKTVLKSVMSGMQQGQEVTFSFVGSGYSYMDRTYPSGTYTVAGVKVGRGKGGSRIAELIAQDGSRFSIGTKSSDLIVNVTVDGTMHGYESEADIPPAYERNLEAAARLKESLRPLVGNKSRPMLSVESTIEDFNGKFVMMSAGLMRGRTGQVKLTLVPAGNKSRTIELWSLRHSGIVSRISICGKDAKELFAL